MSLAGDPATVVAAIAAGTALTLAPLDPHDVRAAHQVVDPDAPMWIDPEIARLLGMIDEQDRQIDRYTRTLEAIGWRYDQETRNTFAWLDNARAWRGELEDQVLRAYGAQARTAEERDDEHLAAQADEALEALTAGAPVTVADLAADLDTSVREVSERVSDLCRARGPRAVIHTAASGNGATLLHADAAERIRASWAPAGSLEADLLMVAELLSARGVWTGEGTFGADTEYGPIDPVGAAWLAIHATLPHAFTNPQPDAAGAATAMVLQDHRVLRLVEFMSANTDSTLADQAPIERLADWAARTPANEVVGRIARLALPGTHLAA